MNDQISALLAETHNSLREQLNAAQRHFDRLQQLLETRESRDIANLNRAARRLRSSGSEWAQVLVEAGRGILRARGTVHAARRRAALGRIVPR